MAESVRVKDLLGLPEHIRKGDFVVKLAEWIDDPRAMAATYKVTPALADAFDRALRLVGSALRDHKSQAAYLRGSFGSGKSHFMALLSLLLAGNEDAWRVPELHPLRERHELVGKKRLLELHFHRVDRASLESAIFAEYLAFARAKHPEAPVPALFGDDKLFAMAADPPSPRRASPRKPPEPRGRPPARRVVRAGSHLQVPAMPSGPPRGRVPRGGPDQRHRSAGGLDPSRERVAILHSGPPIHTFGVLDAA